jgi:multidrug efflux pump subunit AcrB
MNERTGSGHEGTGDVARVSSSPLIGGGGLAIFSMRVDIFPPFNLPQIYVIQNFNGMSPAQMEGLIVNQFELNFQ